jgi:hypothetical protein
MNELQQELKTKAKEADSGQSQPLPGIDSHFDKEKAEGLHLSVTKKCDGFQIDNNEGTEANQVSCTAKENRQRDNIFSV